MNKVHNNFCNKSMTTVTQKRNKHNNIELKKKKNNIKKEYLRNVNKTLFNTRFFIN